MAFRATGPSMLRRLSGNRHFATSTTPKMKPSITAADAAHDAAHHAYNKYAMNGEFAPIYMLAGMMMVAASIGTHTAKQQLMHCPNVSVSKKKRRSVTEVDNPDRVIDNADNYVNKSFFRKMAHIQDYNRVLPDPMRPDPFTKSRNIETLKTAGVDPRIH